MTKEEIMQAIESMTVLELADLVKAMDCLLYTSTSPRDA